MYQILKDFGTQAILISTEEIRDRENFFLDRLNLPIPNVLSNVYPKNTGEDSANLKQFFSMNLPGGKKLYFVNIQDDDQFKYSKTIQNHYDVIPADVLLEKFIPQTNPFTAARCSVQAISGSWQVAQEIVPSLLSRLSK